MCYPLTVVAFLIINIASIRWLTHMANILAWEWGGCGLGVKRGVRKKTLLLLLCSVIFDSLWLHGLQPSWLLCPWDSPRILEWIAIFSSRGSSWPRDRASVSYISCIGKWILLPLNHLQVAPNTLLRDGYLFCPQVSLQGWGLWQGLWYVQSHQNSLVRTPWASSLILLSQIIQTNHH